MLCNIPDEEEIKKDIFDLNASSSLNANSSPGPNEFGGAFYQNCWDIVKVDLVNLIQHFFTGAELSRFYTSTYLVLFPRVDNPSSFHEMRPISPSNYSYKIISKIMSSRLNSILPKLLSHNQTCFLKDNSITENILLA